MMIRIELSTAGLGRLEAFCAERLRDGLDPRETAFALMQEAGFGGDDPVHITVPADLCADGQEAKLLFTDQRDFIKFRGRPRPSGRGRIAKSRSDGALRLDRPLSSA